MTTIKLKNGSGAPTAGDLVQGEPALDLTNKRLYTEDSGGTVIEVGTNPGEDVTFADDRKAVFGAGSDLEIYHESSTGRSFIKETGADEFRILGSNIRIKNGDDSKTYMQMTDGGSVAIRHNDATKLETTSTGIDVTGTVTADGLTVDGSATIQSTSSPAISVIDTTNNVEARLQAFNSTATVGTQSNHSFSIETNDTTRALFSTGGDISFYEDTGTTAKLFWDASAESLSIGTSSVAGALHVEKGNNYSGTDFEDNPHLLISNGTPTNHTAVLMFQSSGADVANKRSGITGGNYYSNKHGLSFLGDLSGKDRSATPDMFIDASGQVGIGTSSPSVALEVDGTIKASGNGKLQIADDTEGSTFEFNVGGDGALEIYDGATERMRIDASGHLQLSGSTDNIIRSGSDSSRVRIFGGGTESVANGAALTLQGVNHSSGNFIDIASASGGYINFRNGTSDAMRIDASGQVGIGTNSPSQPLHVDATGGTTAALFDNNGTNGDVVRVGKNGTDILKIRAEGTADLALDASGGAFIFKEGGSEAMRLDASGNLLVGTTSTTADEGGIVARPDSDVSNIYIGHATGTAGGNPYIRFRYGTGNIGSITQSGTTAVLYNTTSDQRLKDNIVDAPSASDDIDAIQVRSFDWKADGSHQKYGMVAQELQSVAPEAVSGDADSDDMMGVDYSKLVPMLVKEIQSLRARVAQLEGAN